MPTMGLLHRASCFFVTTNQNLRIASSQATSHFGTTVCFSSQVKHHEGDNSHIGAWVPSLTRTQVRSLRVALLREELAKRGLEIAGTRPVLVSRLLEAVSGDARQKAPTAKEGCPKLDPDRTYVLRVTCHRGTSSAGAGLVLYDTTDVKEVWVARKYFPERLGPLESEYRGAILGLRYASRQRATKMILQTDNDIMIKQIRGEFNVSKEVLRKLCWIATGLLEKFDDWQLLLITAVQNTRAKNLARGAVGTKKSMGLPEEYGNEDSIADGLTPMEGVESSEMRILPEKTYLLRWDGGSRGNPGVAGLGMVLYEMEKMKELWCGWKYLGTNFTNNESEYHGLLLGMQCAVSLGVCNLRAEGDSLLVVKHLLGRYKCRDPRLKQLLQQCQTVIDTLDSFEVEFIRREVNKRADQLAQQAMDTQESFGFEEFDYRKPFQRR